MRKNMRLYRIITFLICIFLITGVFWRNVFTVDLVNAVIPESEEMRLSETETVWETDLTVSETFESVDPAQEVSDDTEEDGTKEDNTKEDDSCIIGFGVYDDTKELPLFGTKSVQDVLPDTMTAVYADGTETVIDARWKEIPGFGEDETANWVFELDVSQLCLDKTFDETSIPKVTVTAYVPEYVQEAMLYQLYSAGITSELNGSTGVLTYGSDQYLSYYNSTNYTRTYYVEAGGSTHSGFCSKASYYAPAAGGIYTIHEIPGVEKAGAIVKAMLITNPVYGPHKDSIWSTVGDGYLVADGKTFWNVHSALSYYWADDLWGTSSKSTAAIQELGEYLYNTWIPQNQEIFDACHAYYLCSSSLDHTSNDKGAKCPSGKQDILFVTDDYNPVRYLRIQKTFEGGSSNYSPDSDAAVYGIFTDEACSNAYVTPYLSGNQSQFRIESDGYTGHIPVESGVYYIKEVKAPAGYELDSTVYKADLTQVNSYEAPHIVNSVNRLSEGRAQVVKYSANENVTAGNDAYSLEGAVYGIFTSKTDASSGLNVKAKLSTAADGKSGTVKLAAGTYYVKELTAPSGYVLDETVYTMTVSSGETKVLKVYDAPKTGNTDILAAKYDAALDFDTSGNLPQGNAVLSDAQFTVKFYGGIYENLSRLQSVSPLKTWILKTDAQGFCRLGSTYLVSGDSFYTDRSGNIVMPLGTLTIQETKAPNGYCLNNEVFLRTLSESTDSQRGVTVFNYPKVSQEIICGGVQIQKGDMDTGLLEPAKDKTFEGAVFEIINMSSHSVIVNGQSYASGDSVGTIESDALGIAKTASMYLPFGKYKIREIKAPGGYLLEGVLEREFKITDHDVLVDLTDYDHAILDTSQKGSIAITKKDSLGNLLTNVSFALEYYDESKGEWKSVAQKATDEHGQVVFEKLVFGDYRITETKTLDGMSLLAEQIMVKIPYVVLADSDATGKRPSYKIGTENYHCDIEYTVSNNKVAVFPETGGTENIWVVYSVVSVWIILTAVFYIKRIFTEDKNVLIKEI